ncbi:trihelix transcription factor ASR3 [Brachypodium distachyon]|nr:trihelix transcription factor ASR3 [Brachypodium distachyon]|eukprot:XP_003567424.3 trihelix transcription factor ASR3 [Brachypodium distachyon]
MSATNGTGNGDSLSPAAMAGATTPRSRLPRWTRHETLVLIQAKRATEQRAAAAAQGQPVRLKWAVVSGYCRRHGVERGPMQCRKRWGNLSWDLKKILVWEKKNTKTKTSMEKEGEEEEEEEKKGEGQDESSSSRPSFWEMRGEQRRARQLPSSFDREVYDALVGAAASVKLPPAESGEEMDLDDDEDEDGGHQQIPMPMPMPAQTPPPPPVLVMPISARMYVPPASSQHECSDPATESAKKPGSDKNSTSQQDSEATFGAGVGAEGTATAATATTSVIGRQVTEALERGNRVLAEQLEAQRASAESDREHRAALLAAVNRLADAVSRIADKL